MTLARRGYGWLVRALLPLARVYLRRRGRRQPAYLEHWDERFATAPLGVPPGAIWLHAVSVAKPVLLHRWSPPCGPGFRSCRW